MMACCEFCYEKYLTIDGKIIWEVLYKLQMKKPYRQVLKEGEERPVCKCSCHREGVRCLH